MKREDAFGKLVRGDVFVNCEKCGISFWAYASDERRFCGQKCAGKDRHGQHKTRLYRIWGCMKGRCLRKTTQCYAQYGGRGISVCKEWQDGFESFRDWALANGYNDTLQIDRIDNNGNYEPGNCRWVEQKINLLNRRKRPNTKSIFRGVSLGKPGYRSFIGRISINGMPKFICHFRFELHAAMHYDREALRIRGAEAKLNFPERRSIYIDEINAGVYGAHMVSRKKRPSSYSQPITNERRELTQ